MTTLEIGSSKTNFKTQKNKQKIVKKWILMRNFFKKICIIKCIVWINKNECII